jgi:hypothetical protein
MKKPQARRGLWPAALLVGRGGVEPPTFHFSGGRSYQLSYLPERAKPYRRRLGPTKTAARVSGVVAAPKGTVNLGSPTGPALCCRPVRPPSSSGPGPRPFTAVARVRIPLGVRCGKAVLISGDAGRGLNEPQVGAPGSSGFAGSVHMPDRMTSRESPYALISAACFMNGLGRLRNPPAPRSGRFRDRRASTLPVCMLAGAGRGTCTTPSRHSDLLGP